MWCNVNSKRVDFRSEKMENGKSLFQFGCAVAVICLTGISASAQDLAVERTAREALGIIRNSGGNSDAGSPFSVGSRYSVRPRSRFTLGSDCGQLSEEGRRYPIAIRLGAMVSPRTKFAGGVDVTLPGVSIGHGWTGRVDAEAIVSANFGGITTLVPLTIDQVYYAPERTGSVRFYGGAGIGPYFGEVTRFGGKLFVGANFTRHLSGEVGVHFAGSGDALVTTQVRFPL